MVSKFNIRSWLSKKILLTWLPLAFIITALSGLVYGATQQVYRQSANDPQIQLAEDVATELSNGLSPQSLPASHIQINQSLATFAIIYGANHQVIASQAELNGQTPSLPPGVFNTVDHKGQASFTWQPSADARIAAAIASYHSSSQSGYVLVGRSLKEVEQRENRLMWQVAAGWVFTLSGSYLLVYFLPKFKFLA